MLKKCFRVDHQSTIRAEPDSLSNLNNFCPVIEARLKT